ncbi:MAG TPA: ABC transporter substrate-binding protein [Mycobacteriales bacterium]|jgi:peptide/nickel transport system substrate-binding protein|nr:ABC transporter substrate-binding protein [Mycobacteriales bacterium]
MLGTKARRAIVLAAVAALSVAVSSCAKSDRSDDAAGGNGAQTSSKDTLVFGAAGDPKMFDPAFASDGETFRVLKQVFEGLVKTKEGSADIEPALATKWESSPDGKDWTFTLRQGVKFSDGTPFNADAVCFNFNRWYNFTGALQSPDVSTYWQDTFGGFAKNESADLPSSLYKSCTASGETAKLSLTSATGRIPAALALPSFAMQSPTALAKYDGDKVTASGDTFQYPSYAQAHPTGTGPYMFAGRDEAQKTVTITANPNYWGDKAKINKIVFKVIPDNNARKQELQAGSIDGYDLVAPGDISGLKTAGEQILDRPPFNILYLGMNQKNPALAKPLVRQAIALAINRDALVKSSFPPAAQVAKEFMPPEVAGYADDVTTYNYDPAKAKALLAQAGESNLTLNFWWPTEVSRPYMPDPKQIFSVIQADLQKAGIKITPVAKVWNSGYLTGVQTGKADLHLLGWTGDYNDAYNFDGTFFGRPKPDFGFTNKPLFDAIAKADAIPDATQRADAYKGVNRQIMDFVPAVPLVHSPPSVAVASNVKDFVPSPVLNDDFSLVFTSGQ